MLLFLNLECILGSSSYGAHAPGALGLPDFEAALAAWPALRIVITSEMRYRMTLEALRGCFSPGFRSQVVDTTLHYGALAQGPRLTREQEIQDWLWHARERGADWIALDNRIEDFARHADRLVACPAFSAVVISELQTKLLLHAVRQESSLTSEGATPTRPASQRPVAAEMPMPGPRRTDVDTRKPAV